MDYGYNQPGERDVQYAPGYPPQQAGYPVQSQPTNTTNTTTVIVQQPMQMTQGPRAWSSDVCSCCDDMGICIFATFCGLCHAMQVSSDLGESSCVPCCVPGAGIVLRTKLRTQENIQGSVMDDCMVMGCCGPCAWCQLAREVRFIQQRNGARPM